MFTNPDTLWIEILVIAVVVLFVGFLIGRHIYKKVHHLPTGDCACCHKSTKRMINEYHKLYNNKNEKEG